MKRTKIAIVTADFNNHNDTDDWLESSKNLDTEGLDVLWLVVDNGSDVSVEKTLKKHKGITWLQTGRNLGFTGGFNRGMKYAKEWAADYVLIINNDTLFSDRNLLKELINVFEKHPKVGVTSPKIYFAPGFEFYKDKYKKEDEGKVIWYAGGKFDWNNIQSKHRGIDEIDTGKYDKTEETEYISGCCVLVKREVLERVGYFEEKLFAYFEDADWIERIKTAGFEQWYCGETSIFHKVSRTTGIGSPWTDYLTTRNRIWFAMKYAKSRTKSAVLRETFRLLFTGRKMQREGVIDYFRGIWGWKNAKQPKDPKYPLGLSVVIVNYKTTELTLKLLDSIFKKNYSGFDKVKCKAEVIVLDNSPDESCEKEVKEKYPDIKFIANKVNNGFAAANNQLINYSLGKYVLLLNSDIEVKKNSLTNLLNAVEKYKDRALYAGRLWFPDKTLQDSTYKLPNAWRAFQQYFLNIKGSYFMDAPTSVKPVQVECAVMACFLIPRRVLNELGYLQEETFMYFEDIEYCRRAKNANIPVWYIPDANFIHYHGQSSKKAGTTVSNERNIEAAKWYHGKLGYFMVTSTLWAGQKWNKILGKDITPESRWKRE